jgi:hypothetical protein
MSKQSRRKRVNHGNKNSDHADARPIWEVAAEIAASIPESDWAKLPTDLSSNIDHYLYGAPKAGK